MIRRGTVQAHTEEVPQRERVGRAPRDAPLRIEAFEIADQQQAEIDPGRQARAAHRVGIELGALRFGELVELLLAQQLIQARVKRMTGGRRQVRRGDPHGWLSGAFPFAHCHAHSVVRG
jgi:hypothetical protein